MRHSTRSAAPLALLPAALALVALTPADAHAQSSRLFNALGYGITGGSIGLAATASATCSGDEFICIPGEMVVATLGGTVLGLVLGTRVASTANRLVAEGRPVSGGRRAAVAFGTVVGGATLGLVVGGVLINPSGAGTFLGSDEQTLTVLAVAGATLGFLKLRAGWADLTRSRVVEVSPLAMVHGRPGVVLRLAF